MDQRLSALVLGALGTLSCAHASATAAVGGSVAPEQPAVSAESAALAAFAGRYDGLQFTLAENTCGSEFANGVNAVVIDSDAQVLYSEGENRRYAARVEEGELVADGYFGPDEGQLCDDDSQFYERWRFRKQANGTLSGTVEGLWPLPPAHCDHPCTVRFSVTTGPSTGPGHAPIPGPPTSRFPGEEDEDI